MDISPVAGEGDSPLGKGKAGDTESFIARWTKSRQDEDESTRQIEEQDDDTHVLTSIFDDTLHFRLRSWPSRR